MIKILILIFGIVTELEIYNGLLLLNDDEKNFNTLTIFRELKIDKSIEEHKKSETIQMSKYYDKEKIKNKLQKNLVKKIQIAVSNVPGNVINYEV
jgi:hypothetical protein